MASAAWTGTHIVAVGDGVYLSADGSEWEKQTEAPSGLTEVIWTGSQLVALKHSEIHTSPDGKIWTKRESGTTGRLLALSSNGSTIVAVGSHGVILASTDGVSWKTVVPTVSGGVWLYCVTWTGTRFIAAGAGLIRFSADGESWGAGSSPTSEGADFILQADSILLFSAGGRFYTGLAGGGGIMPPGNTTYVDAVWDGRQIVCLGMDGTVATSTDGIAWKTGGGYGSYATLVWTGSRFVALGGAGYAMISPDAKSWTRTGSVSLADFNTVIAAGRQIFAAGTLYSLGSGSLYSGSYVMSDDEGLSWKFAGGVSAVTIRAFTRAGDGILGIADEKLVIRSDLKGGWTVPFRTDSVSIYAMAAGDSLVVAGGYDRREKATAILTSSDHGFHWEKTVLEWNAIVMSITFGNGKFIAAGGLDQVMTSADGRTWTKSSIPGGGRFNSGIWNGEQFVVVGDTGAIWTSRDGSAWEYRISGTRKNLENVVWSGRQFVVLGDGQNWVLTSSDGTQWVSRDMGFPVACRALTWTGSRFLAVGFTGAVMASPEEFSQSILPLTLPVSPGTPSLFSVLGTSSDRLLLRVSGVPAGSECFIRILDGSGKSVQAWRGSAAPALELPAGRIAPGNYFLLGSAGGKTEAQSFRKAK